MASFRKIKTKWSVVFDMPTADGTKRSQKRLSGFMSRREAELAYIAFKGENKVIAPVGKYPFEVVYERYMAYQSNRIKDSTYMSTRHRFEQNILPYFSGKDITQIKITDIIDWQTGLNASNYAFKSKDIILGYLRNFFNYCKDIEEIIPESPIKKQIKFVDNEVKEEMLFYSPEEYVQFRSVIEKEKDRLLFDTLYFTGMRKGELIALKWLDLNSNGKLSITKTYTRKTRDGKWKLTSPKTKNSVREVPLPKFLLSDLINYKNQTSAEDNYFIFGDVCPTNERYLDNARDRYYKAAKVKRIRIHDFRHSHVSYLISCNIDIMTIAKRVGDTVKTILETYAHMLERKQAEVLEKLEEVSSMFVISE